MTLRLPFGGANVIVQPGRVALQEIRNKKWAAYRENPSLNIILHENESSRVMFGDQEYPQARMILPGLTFTPYANPTVCSAHCHYCSEDLIRLHGVRNSSPTLLIRDQHEY